MARQLTIRQVPDEVATGLERVSALAVRASTRLSSKSSRKRSDRNSLARLQRYATWTERIFSSRSTRQSADGRCDIWR
jgi:hypothetical protein